MKIKFHGFTFCVHMFIITSSLFLQIHTIDTTSPTNIVSPAFPPTRPIRLGPALSWGPARSEDPYYNSRSKSYVFDVTNFGAVGDGPTDDTAAFRSAWKAACQVEKGVVFARLGLAFTVKPTIFSGPCQRGLVFQVDGVLMPPDGPDHWPESDGNNNHWLLFDRVSSMSLTGTGTIEGHGQKWWNLPCKPHKGPNGSTLPGPCFSPTLISFSMSSNLVVSGLRIQNSPQVNVKFDECEGVLIDKLSISSPKLSPNTDGIHIENTKSVGIYHSVIANGDDCISIGSGSSDVHIEGVTCGPSHGISIGSLGLHNTRACVSNVTVRNSVLRDSDNGLRVKTWQGGSGSVSGLIFENIQMENVKNCILIDQYYCLTNDCRNQTSAVHVDDVTYKNVKGRCDVSMSPPISFACSDTVPCTNIALSEVELLPYGSETNDPFCWNAYGVQKTKNVPSIECLRDGTHESVEEYYGCSGGAGRVNLFDFIE